jgi:protein ImuB
MTNVRVVCVRAPDFGLQLWQRAHPPAGPGPVVLAETDRPGATVLSVNKAGRAAGIRCGMTVTGAQGRAPGVHTVVRHLAAEQRASRQIVTRLQTLTPAVEEDAPGRWFFESLGQGRLYKNERAFLGRVFTLLRGQGFQICAGLAGNRSTARVAADISAVDSFTIVPAGQEQKFLAALPVEHLPLSPEIRHHLHNLGLCTMAQVAAVPGAEFAARFGREGEAACKLARGEDVHRFQPESLPDVLLHTRVFEFPLFSQAMLLREVMGVLLTLLAVLRTRSKALVRVRVTFDLEHRVQEQAILSLAHPSSSTAPFQRQLQQELSTRSWDVGVRGVAVEVLETGAPPSEQMRLATDRRGTRPGDGTPHMSSARSSGLRIPGARSAPVPEASIHWAEPGDRTGGQPKTVTVCCLPQTAGLRLVQPPRRIELAWSDGTLVALAGIGATERVHQRSGPWTVSGSWWAAPFDRLYYKVDTERHRSYLLFYDRRGGHWYWHGLFD